MCQRIDQEVVAVDGKQLRGSKDGSLGTAGITMVNVWASENQLSLSLTKVDEKTNEITVIPELLRLLDIEGSVITLDVIGCQTAIASQIRQQNADCVFAVKGNQTTLLDDLERTFAHVQGMATLDDVRTVDKGHGRLTCSTPFVLTGRSKIVCIGYWIWLFARMIAVCAKITPWKISPSFANSPSRSASVPNVSGRVGTVTIS